MVKLKSLLLRLYGRHLRPSCGYPWRNYTVSWLAMDILHQAVVTIPAFLSSFTIDHRIFTWILGQIQLIERNCLPFQRSWVHPRFFSLWRFVFVGLVFFCSSFLSSFFVVANHCLFCCPISLGLSFFELRSLINALVSSIFSWCPLPCTPHVSKPCSYLTLSVLIGPTVFEISCWQGTMDIPTNVLWSCLNGTQMAT